MVQWKICLASVIVLVGIELLTGGILLFLFGDSLIQSNVQKECQLHQGTKIYDTWRNPPLPLTISFYFFDITDQEFINGTKIPVVRELGPFVYRETRLKVDVFTQDNGTISYRERRKYDFDESASIGPESTNITTINIVYMTLMSFVENEIAPEDTKTFLKTLLNIFEHPIMERTVHELLWGYIDPVLNATVGPGSDGNGSVVSIFNASVGEAGLSTFLINNGIDLFQNVSDRLKRAGNIEGYNGRSHVSYWTNEYANMINGTDSTIWHAGATKDDQVYIFSPDLCRSLHLQYAETHYNPFDIENLRFILPDTVFENSAENAGFCLNQSNPVDNSTKIHCLPSGLMSLKSCLKPSGGDFLTIPVPIIASSPHFLGAEKSVQEAVQGLHPDGQKHRSFMDVEPITGTVMNGSRRMQININVINSSAMDEIAHVKPFVFPLLWLDEHAEIDQKHADDFHNSVMVPIKILTIVKYVLLGVGIVLILVSAILVVISFLKRDSSEKLLLINK